MELVAVIVSSSLVAAVVGALAGYLSQRRLAERQAHLDYEYAARKRLYEAIGPLRFQLVLACRDVRRVRDHRSTTWDLDPAGYYGRSFIYRVLRPLAVGELVERQLSAIDLTVDPSSIALLRFSTAAERMLTGGEAILEHPDADWSGQTQHLFRDSLRAAASRLLIDRDGRPSVMTVGEFQMAVQNPHDIPDLRPLAEIFHRCEGNLADNPIFFTRLLAYAYACSSFLAEQDGALGFAERPIDVPSAIRDLDDEYLSRNADRFPGVLDELLAEGL
jgi:hypothetical protein